MDFVPEEANFESLITSLTELSEHIQQDLPLTRNAFI